jgi:hypothetical protein
VGWVVVAHNLALLRQADELQSVRGGLHKEKPFEKVWQTINSKIL